MSTPREPDLPAGEEKPPVGPRDQLGFDHLRPAPDHPAAGEFPPPATAGGGSGGDGPPPVDSDDEDDGPEDEARMGLLDHLDELRSVLIHSAIAATVATILCWFWSAHLLDLLIAPIADVGVYFTAPNEAFLTRLKIAGACGLFIIAPFIFFRFYGFVLPGLYRQERKVITPLLIATTLLFYLGVAFAYLVVVPQVVTFMLSFGTDVMSPLIGVGPYFAFVSRLCLAFGLVFELPLLVFFLSIIGVVNPRMLLRTWRFAVVIIAALAALLTPPDVISQVMMAGPVLVLYMGSVLVSLVVTRRRNLPDGEDADEAAAADRDDATEPPQDPAPDDAGDPVDPESGPDDR